MRYVSKQNIRQKVTFQWHKRAFIISTKIMMSSEGENNGGVARLIDNRNVGDCFFQKIRHH